MKGRTEGTPDPGQQDGGAEDRNRHHQPDDPRITDPAQSGDGEDLSADPALVRGALALLHPEGPWHVSAKKGDENFRGKVEPDLGEAADWAVEQNADGRNVYVSVAALRAGWQGRKAKKEHVASVRWLWVDIDPRAREDPLASMSASGCC